MKGGEQYESGFVVGLLRLKLCPQVPQTLNTPESWGMELLPG